MTKRKIAIAVGTVIVLCAGAAWALMRSGPDPQLENVKRMQADLFKPGAQPDPAKLAELRKAEKELSPAQQQEIGRDRGERFQRRMSQTLATYFSLPADKKTAFLDERIKEMEKWRKAREAERAQQGSQSDSSGAGGGPGGGGPGSGGPGGGGGGAAASGQDNQANRDAQAARRLQRMDSMPATQRAQMQTFRADMNQRRADLGLPPMGSRPLPPR
jgi:uncharacterized membrane protein YgcG